MAKLKAFNPATNLAVSVTPGSAAALQSLVAGGESLLLFNPTNGLVFIRTDGAVASATDYPIPAGGSRLMDVGGGALPVSLFQASGATAGIVYLSRGDGSSY